ncbi:ArsC/Spx/MgsR family protein [Lactococcus garvieae]|uniref:ArsC/Spx/MgsR family protein n=1 Tax=Lactococcus garvieae TaxID=1363 RepID=UPI003D76A75E
MKSNKIENNYQTKLYLYKNGEDIVSKKVEEWLYIHHFLYQIITPRTLSKLHILQILNNSEFGFEEVLAPRNFPGAKTLKEINELTVEELIHEILKKPIMLKKTILFDDINLLVGFNPDEIRKFIPRSYRAIAQRELNGK